MSLAFGAKGQKALLCTMGLIASHNGLPSIKTWACIFSSRWPQYPNRNLEVGHMERCASTFGVGAIHSLDASLVVLRVFDGF